jgi:RNA polymerase primary sigma factor
MKKMKELRIEDRITNRSKNIDRYFNDVGPASLLSSEQEVELTKRIQEGDDRALEIMVKSNLRFVISVAKQYSAGPEMLAELIAQGNIGLIHSARTFDHTRGFKFISYAVWHIRKEILEYLNTYRRAVRIPSNIILAINRSRKVEDFLTNKLGRDATLEEIAEEMTRLEWPITVEKLTHIRSISENGIPLESNDPEETFSPISWLNAEQEESGLFVEDRTTVFNSMCSTMTPVEHAVVSLRLGIASREPISFKEIGETYDRTSEWARQTFNRALKKAKKRAKQLNYTIA